RYDVASGILEERVEQVVGIGGSRAQFGVELESSDGFPPRYEALGRAVVEADVGDLDVGAAREIHGVGVGVGGDVDVAALAGLHRVVGTVVGPQERLGGESEGAGEDLVTEAESQHRHPRAYDLPGE